MNIGSPAQTAKTLRETAARCRELASIPTTGGHESDRLLREFAELLEREADKLAVTT
jgi:hypothetical protein